MKISTVTSADDFVPCTADFLSRRMEASGFIPFVSFCATVTYTSPTPFET